jgi:hypothetical protein
MDADTKKIFDSLADAFKAAGHTDDHNTINAVRANVDIVDGWLNANDCEYGKALGIDKFADLKNRILFVVGLSRMVIK